MRHHSTCDLCSDVYDKSCIQMYPVYPDGEGGGPTYMDVRICNDCVQKYLETGELVRWNESIGGADPKGQSIGGADPKGQSFVASPTLKWWIRVKIPIFTEHPKTN